MNLWDSLSGLLTRMKLTKPAKVKGQLTIPFPLNTPYYFYGATQYTTEYWRKLVKQSDIASACQAVITNRLTALDFHIVPRSNINYQDVSDEIDYYTHLFEVGGGVGSFQSLVQVIVYDLLTSPNGATLEIVRNGDLPIALVPVDAATVRRTGNPSYPIEQIVGDNVIKLPADKVVNAVYMERPFFSSNGEGIIPPEIAHHAILALASIESYLRDVANRKPIPGILNLGDVTREAARRWIEELREDLRKSAESGQPAIPVLYESSGAQFLRLTEPFDAKSLEEAKRHFIAVIVSAYGLTIADIFGSNTDSMSGSIRSERYTRRTGEGAIRRTIENMLNKVLPEYLRFSFLDVYDEEQRAVNSRAFLSAVMALERAVLTKILTPETARAFLESTFGFNFATDSADSSPIPEKLPRSKAKGVSGGVKSVVGDKKPTSQGGFGEVRTDFLVARNTLQDYAKEHFGEFWENHLLRRNILISVLHNPADILALRELTALDEEEVKELIKTLL